MNCEEKDSPIEMLADLMNTSGFGQRKRMSFMKKKILGNWLI
jgi:hypothetical protein